MAFAQRTPKRIGVTDSHSNPQSLNRYAYCLSNPVRYTDPSGHWIPVEDEIPAQLTRPGYSPFGVRYTPTGELRILHGGRYFVNPYEKSFANLLLSGRTDELPSLPSTICT